MYKKYILTIIIILIPYLLNAQISYYDGFHSDMTMAEVKQFLEERNYQNIDIKDDYIFANVLSIKNVWLAYEFHFCENKLVSFRKDFDPSMKNFISLFNDLISKYGNTITGSSHINLSHPMGEIREIVLTWELSNIEIELSYMILETNDNLTVRFFMNNKCGKW